MRKFSIALLLIAATCSTVFAQDEKPKEDADKDKATTVALKPEFAGDEKGKKTILIAWSFDDGPTDHTKRLMSELGINNVTWFVVKANLLTKTGKWKENMKRYNGVVAAGGEVGIHMQDEKIDQKFWFPAKGTAGKDYYATIEEAMADLKTFHGELNKEGLDAKFIRLPGGLTSELQKYATHVGFTKNLRKVANAIQAGQAFSTLGYPNKTEAEKKIFKKLNAGYNKMLADYTTFKKALNDQQLLLWNNTENPNVIKAESWETETSGVIGRHDKLTKAVTHLEARKKEFGADYVTATASRFERLAAQTKPGTTRSYIVLAHDTTNDDVDAILEDKKVMEAHAKANGVKIEYVTLSTLFKRTTGKDAATFKPSYK
jgi:peptidoglycan/xylan/chitin deacetylase (PgdA/CDA1 family)